MKKLLFLFAVAGLLNACKPEDTKIEDPDKSPDLDAKRTLLTTKETDQFLRDVDFADPLNGIAIGLGTLGSQALYYRTTDGGESWTKEAVPQFVNGITNYALYAIHFENGHGFISGGSTNGFFIAKSSDKGYTWKVKTGFISNVPVEFDFFGRYGIGVGNFGIIWTTNDSGETWKESTIPGTENLVQVSFADETHVYASSGASMYFSADQGKTWTKKLNQNGNGQHMEMLDANSGFSSTGFAILKTSDGGDNWQTRWKTDSYHGFNENFLVGDASHVAMQHIPQKHFLISSDGGSTFKSYKLPHHDNFNISLDSKGIWIRYAVVGDHFIVLPNTTNTPDLCIYKIRFR